MRVCDRDRDWYVYIRIYADSDAVARRQPILVFVTGGAAGRALCLPGFMRKEQQGLEPQPRAQPPGAG